MKTMKHRVTATVIAAAFALTFASGCGAEVGSTPSEIGNVNQDAPTPTESRPHGSPDSLDRGPTQPYASDAVRPPDPSVNSAPCVFSPDAAERLGRPVCPG